MNFKQQLVVAYDKDVKRRNDAEDKRDQWKLDARRQFVNLLEAENRKIVLELGSGVGLDAKFFQDEGFNVLATDLSKEMVKMCKKRGLKAKVVDLYCLSSLGITFDAIYSMNALLHVPRKDLKSVLENIYQALNKGGTFFYGVYGGKDEEKVFTDKTKMNLPRFFSFLSDKTLLSVVKKKFEVIDFGIRDFNDKKPNLHFQSLLLRKR